VSRPAWRRASPTPVRRVPLPKTGEAKATDLEAVEARLRASMVQTSQDVTLAILNVPKTGTF